jgi:hypothetical protein
MPDSLTPPPIKSHKPYPTEPLIYELAFWCYVWLGSAVAGGCFGFFVGFMGSGALGLFFGFMFAGIAAAPILVTVSIAAWAFWLTRFRLISAAIAGVLTGFASAKFVEMPGLNFSDMTWIFGRMNYSEASAALCGAVACPLFGYLFCRGMIPHCKNGVKSRKLWQFTLRDLFVHFTVLAVLISLWSWLFTYCRDVEKQRQSMAEQRANGP